MTSQYLPAMDAFGANDFTGPDDTLRLQKYVEEWESRIEQCAGVIREVRQLQQPFTDETWSTLRSAWIEITAIKDTWKKLADHYEKTLQQGVKNRLETGKAAPLLKQAQADYTVVKKWYDA